MSSASGTETLSYVSFGRPEFGTKSGTLNLFNLNQGEMNKQTSKHLSGAKPYSTYTVQTLFLTEYDDPHFTDEETKALKLRNLSRNQVCSKIIHCSFHFAVCLCVSF